MSARQVWDPMKNTGHGRPTGPKGKRPTGDSLPRHECGVEGCGEFDRSDSARLLFELKVTKVTYTGPIWTRWSGHGRWFCSLGCLGRWSALEELRQP